MSLDADEIQEIFGRLRLLEKQVEAIAEQTGVTLPSAPEDPVVVALRQGDYMQAIKLYQHQTGAGLGESKAAVDAMKASLGV